MITKTACYKGYKILSPCNIFIPGEVRPQLEIARLSASETILTGKYEESTQRLGAYFFLIKKGGEIYGEDERIFWYKIHLVIR